MTVGLLWFSARRLYLMMTNAQSSGSAPRQSCLHGTSYL